MPFLGGSSSDSENARMCPFGPSSFLWLWIFEQLLDSFGFSRFLEVGGRPFNKERDVWTVFLA